MELHGFNTNNTGQIEVSLYLDLDTLVINSLKQNNTISIVEAEVEKKDMVLTT